MSNVKLPGSNIFDFHMQIHTDNQKDDVSLAKEFQHHPIEEHHKNGVFDQGKNNKQFMEIKWTDRKYHVQDKTDVAHKYVRMYCNKNQSPALPFCGPHSKTNGTRVLSKHYHFFLDTELGNGVGEVIPIKCTCVACTSILYKPQIYGIPPYEQNHYKHVTNCTYWPVLGLLR